MFFNFQKWKKNDCKIQLSASAQIRGFEGYAQKVVEKWIADFGIGNADFLVTAQKDAALPAEGYAVLLQENKISVRYSDFHAMIYAAQTLLQLSEHDELFVGEILDKPDCAFRGYRAYLPGRKAFQDFYDTVDFLAYYKYNFISLEVGGAMEYKRHPEINQKWAEFAAETHRYSGRAHEIQNGFPWAKNSIHTDNADGEILTQDEVKKLIAYCEARGLEVYPEVPTLSHCDYICMAHPEIAERQADPYPDTYCPSNPKSYELVFDILEEVIAVFQPKLINIGHDEFYSMCLCEKCREKRPQDVFADDVTKIYNWLKARNIKTAMWCDKLLPVVTKQGKTYGGAGFDRVNSNGIYVQSPPTFQCQSMLPRDILMINWYCCFGMQYDLMLHMHGYPMIFGNMSVGAVENWRMRRNFGLYGGSCSNWGRYTPVYMQRNCQYQNLAMGAYAMWSREYDNNQFSDLRQKVFEELYRKHYGNRSGYIEVTHTTKKHIPYKVFYDGEFIENEIYDMGKYRLTYTDGTVENFDVRYGQNIASDTLWQAFEEEFNPTVGVAEDALGEVSYSTVPQQQNGRTVYRTAFRNPHPQKSVRSFEYIPQNEDVELIAVRFYSK